MDIKVALKNALGTIQTPTTAANYQATDLVPLFDSNDQLIGKISRNELMSAVKTSLGTLLNQGAADLGTSLAKIPALNSGGTLGSATVANLASVLGGAIPTQGKGDLNDYTQTSVSFLYNTQQLNKPTDVTGGILFTIAVDENMILQILANNGAGICYYRTKWVGNWADWQKLTVDMPSFYKDYSTLAGLALAVGGMKYVGTANTCDSVIGQAGVYAIGDDPNKPFTYCRLLSFADTNASYAVQIAFNLSTGHNIAFRLGDADWKYIDAV